MFSRKVYARLLIPAAALVVSENEDLTCRPSELPIYVPDEKKAETTVAVQEISKPSKLENFFGSIRKNVFTVYHEAKGMQEKTSNLIQDSRDNFDWLVKYLQEDQNTNAKYGAIAIGGLTGYILGLRGGIFRRSLFATAGAAGMAAVCYPEEAAEYAELAHEEGRKYAQIAYNFIYGVKKDDPPLELPTLPKLPTSLGEAWETAANVGKSVKSMFSESEEAVVTNVEQQEQQVQENVIEINPEEIVSQAYQEATQKSCHCPVGVCTRHDELPPNQSEESKSE